MKLLEYEAKQLLVAAKVPTPHGAIVGIDDSQTSISTPVVLKSQVPTGRRGKAGGVIIVREPSDLLLSHYLVVQFTGSRRRSFLLKS